MRKIEKVNVADILSLTPMQKGMLIYYLKNPKSDIYFEQLLLEVEGEIDDELFKKAWYVVTNNNEMLRTVFRWEGLDEPIQIILKEQEPQVSYFDFSFEKKELQYKSIEEMLQKDRMDKFDLTDVAFRVTLCKVTQKRSYLIVTNHHILYDGWSSGIILKEFLTTYKNLSEHKEVRRLSKNKYKEFVKFIHDQNKENQRNFWSKYLGDISKQSIQETKVTPTRLEIENYLLIEQEYNKDQIFEFVSKKKITLATFLYTAWGILLHKYEDSTEVLFGTTVSGRTPEIPGIENMVGLFINTVPLQISIREEQSILEVLYHVHQRLNERKEHENTSLVDIKEYCNISGNNQIFNSIVVLENYPLDELIVSIGEPLKIKSYSMFIQAQFDLIFNISVVSNLEITICYNKNKYEKEAIEEMGKYLQKIMKRMLDTLQEQTLKITDIEWINSIEKNEIYAILREDTNKINVDFDFDF